MSGELTSPWISIQPDSWNVLIHGREPILFKKNTMVFHEGEQSETIYIVVTGRVCITQYQASGAEKQLYIAELGSMFGEGSCLTGSPHSATAVTIVDSLLHCIPWEEAAPLMRADWSLTEKIIHVIYRKKAILQKQVVELSFSDSLQRIAQMLINLSNEYGEREPDGGVRISIRFTHQNVANLTNVSRVTVSNVFQILAGRGILVKKDGLFSLHHLPLLRDMADGAYFE